jgi:hypothetical protein
MSLNFPYLTPAPTHLPPPFAAAVHAVQQQLHFQRQHHAAAEYQRLFGDSAPLQFNSSLEPLQRTGGRAGWDESDVKDTTKPSRSEDQRRQLNAQG